MSRHGDLFRPDSWLPVFRNQVVTWIPSHASNSFTQLVTVVRIHPSRPPAAGWHQWYECFYLVCQFQIAGAGTIKEIERFLLIRSSSPRARARFKPTSGVTSDRALSRGENPREQHHAVLPAMLVNTTSSTLIGLSGEIVATPITQVPLASAGLMTVSTS